jgi:hypothetical protein
MDLLLRMGQRANEDHNNAEPFFHVDSFLTSENNNVSWSSHVFR